MKDRIVKESMLQVMRLGPRKFVVEDVAKELGISKKTIYKFFSSKDEIISAVVDLVIEKEKAYLQEVQEKREGPLPTLNNLLFLYSEDRVPAFVVDEFRHHYTQQYEKREVIKQLKRDYTAQLIVEGKKSGDIRKDVNQEVLNVLISQTMEALLEIEFLEHNDLTLSQAIDQLKKIILYGIATRNE